jgi:hypothetical protein
MYENEEVYSMKGETKIVFGPGDSMGGGYQFGDKFLNKNARSEFRNYAETLWKTNNE